MKISSLKFLPLMLIAVFCVNCDSSKSLNSGNRLNDSNNVSSPNQQISEDLLITLERTACYGLCAVYNVAVKADGSVTFEGINNTEIKGKNRGQNQRG